MSDYLGHLLERSFAPTWLVRPQNPSLFEPSRTNGSLDRSSPDLERTSESESSGPVLSVNEQKRTPPAALAGSQSPQPDETQIPLGNVTPTNERNLQRDFAVETGVLVPPLIPSKKLNPLETPESPAKSDLVESNPTEAPDSILATQSFRRSRPATSAKIPQRETAEPAAAIPLRAHPFESEKVSPAVSPHGTISRPSHESAEQTAVQNVLSPLNTRHLPMAETSGIVPAVRPARIVPQATARQPASPAGKNRAEHAAVETNAPPVPTIQVTIGRVEVRATVPPATTRTKPAREPEMSLSAYLHHRAEGGRR